MLTRIGLNSEDSELIALLRTDRTKFSTGGIHSSCVLHGHASRAQHARQWRSSHAGRVEQPGVGSFRRLEWPSVISHTIHRRHLLQPLPQSHSCLSRYCHAFGQGEFSAIGIVFRLAFLSCPQRSFNSTVSLTLERLT